MNVFKKFWMVLGNGVPVYRHETPEEANCEAERLARLNRGQEFVVLEAVAKVCVSDVVWCDAVEECEMPF